MSATAERRSPPAPRGHALLGIAPEVRREQSGVLPSNAVRAPLVPGPLLTLRPRGRLPARIERRTPGDG